MTSLPPDFHSAACAVEVAGADEARTRMDGPAARAPEQGRMEEAGEESEPDDAEDDPLPGLAAAEAAQDVPEDSIAVDLSLIHI